MESIFENKFLSVKCGTKDRKKKSVDLRNTSLVIARDLLVLYETISIYIQKIRYQFIAEFIMQKIFGK